MAKRKRKTSGRSTASRRKNRTQDRMPAGLITLFAGLVLMALAFVPGSSAWRTMHDVLFGVFGCGSFVLGAALCYLAILYTRGEDLLPHIAKLALGLIFASGTVIVFSDISTDQTAAQMTAACYHNGMSAWLSGGALGAVLGGTLLLLCGRPAANLVLAGAGARPQPVHFRRYARRVLAMALQRGRQRPRKGPCRPRAECRPPGRASGRTRRRGGRGGEIRGL